MSGKATGFGRVKRRKAPSGLLDSYFRNFAKIFPKMIKVLRLAKRLTSSGCSRKMA